MARILAIDLGKFKSVACLFNTGDGEYSFQTVQTNPAVFQDLLATTSPDRIVIEIGSQAGWIADLAEAVGIEIQVANPNHEAWRWKNVRRKTDRDDALRLAHMSDAGVLPLVHSFSRRIRSGSTGMAQHLHGQRLLSSADCPSTRKKLPSLGRRRSAH